VSNAWIVILTLAYLLALAVAWTRERRRGQWLERATLALLVVCVAGGFSAITEQARNVEREGVERRDQICLSAERDHLASVEGLRRTYLYLTLLTERQRREPFNRFLMMILPESEKEAAFDVAPRFCDEPGVEAEKHGAAPVGLPEPDPVIPCRPEDVVVPAPPPQSRCTPFPSG
jgi:hypothetical protein